ncbi:MAG TPA: sulfite exporter TauE/SafE family protein [Flavipsychrobacter sp.]|nr:sulfite exporter TauE/SafE family protein [Flavipsychrobacter sp.]
MNSFSITMALVMGLTGSLHCAGMCGPIIWVMPFQMITGFRKWLGIALYHFGRISIYALLGFILHSFKSIFNPQVQQYVSIALGVLLLIIGIISFIPNNKISIKLPWTEFIKKQLGKFIGNPKLGTLFISGSLNGLLPCGLVYMALSMSVTADSALQSVALMYAFGLGTIPALVALTVLKNKATFLRTNHIRKMVPVLMFAFGCLFILRGMNLGIPYVSPQVVLEQETIKASCCHKPK